MLGKNGNHSLKWWFNGNLPWSWSKVKKHPKKNTSISIAMGLVFIYLPNLDLLKRKKNHPKKHFPSMRTSLQSPKVSDTKKAALIRPLLFRDYVGFRESTIVESKQTFKGHKRQVTQTCWPLQLRAQKRGQIWSADMAGGEWWDFTSTAAVGATMAQRKHAKKKP